MPVLDDWIAVAEAASKEFLDVSKQRVHQLVEKYGIRTRYINPRLKLLKRTDVAKVAAMHRASGVHIDKRSKPRRRNRTTA